jgi:hypothetical protein
MFDWFRTQRDYEMPIIPVMPKVEPPKKEQEQYSIGITDDNRITLKIGYTTLTMNQQGAGNLIRQLELFASQLEEDKKND